MEIIIINAQRKIKLNRKRIKPVIEKILKILKLPKDSIVSINFVGSERISKLNGRYFKKRRVTDVIALGYKNKKQDRLKSGHKGAAGIYRNYLGDIVVCPAVALENSRLYKNTFFKELTLYIIHGILHLLGYDDTGKLQKAEMLEKEAEVLERI